MYHGGKNVTRTPCGWTFSQGTPSWMAWHEWPLWVAMNSPPWIVRHKRPAMNHPPWMAWHDWPGRNPVMGRPTWTARYAWHNMNGPSLIARHERLSINAHYKWSHMNRPPWMAWHEWPTMNGPTWMALHKRPDMNGSPMNVPNSNSTVRGPYRVGNRHGSIEDGP